MALQLSIYDIIQGPVISDKAYRLYQNLKKIVLKVHPQANKRQVIEALERLFNVKVKTVRIVIRKGKLKRPRMNRVFVQDPLEKRAIVTLADGYSLDLLTQGGTVAPETTSVEPVKEAQK
ncbi:50S ribosomal protein L23 [Candidatus Babeliales bacterium]|nr:50S ribosomal protein L23 [Candidatus Babeliales bacterium]